MKITLQRTSPNYRQKLSTHRIMRELTIALLVLVVILYIIITITIQQMIH